MVVVDVVVGTVHSGVALAMAKVAKEAGTTLIVPNAGAGSVQHAAEHRLQVARLRHLREERMIRAGGSLDRLDPSPRERSAIHDPSALSPPVDASTSATWIRPTAIPPRLTRTN